MKCSRMRYGERKTLSTRKRGKLWARGDIVMSNAVRFIFRKIQRVPLTENTSGQVTEEVIFMWDIPVCGEYKLVQKIVNHTQ